MQADIVNENTEAMPPRAEDSTRYGFNMPGTQPNDILHQLWAIVEPGAIFEVRIPKARFSSGYIVNNAPIPTTVSGIFDDIEKAAFRLQCLKDVNAYVTINPLVESLRKRRNFGYLDRITTGEGVSRDDITRRNWVFIDVDANKAPGFGDSSASDEERTRAISIRDRILAENPLISRSAIYGTSGNGGWIIVWIGGIPNDGESLALVQSFLATLGKLYTGADAKIDPAVHDANRIMSIAGTKKCKGSDTIDRPWRFATIDSPPGSRDGRVPFDARRWVLANGGEILRTPEARVKVSAGADGVTQEVSWALESMPGRPIVGSLRKRILAFVAGSHPSIQGNHGNTPMYSLARELISGWALDVDEAMEFMMVYNKTLCKPEWSARELTKALNAVAASPDPSGKPRGHRINEAKPNRWVSKGFPRPFTIGK